jgi:hypothetical protein
MAQIKISLAKKIRGPYYPTVTDGIDGKFVNDGQNWIPVSIDATFEEALQIYDSATKGKLLLKLNPAPKVPNRQWEVKSSTDAAVTYIVRLWGSEFSCNCIGYGFRKNCSHIKDVKKQIGVE